MLIEFLFSAICGFGLHQARRITDRFPTGWRELTNYVVGVVGLLTLFPLWYRRLHGENGERRSWAAFALASLGLGFGVASGWAVDTVTKR